MSALPPKADMCSALGDVRFGPIADSCTAAKGYSITSSARLSSSSLLAWTMMAHDLYHLVVGGCRKNPPRRTSRRLPPCPPMTLNRHRQSDERVSVSDEPRRA